MKLSQWHDGSVKPVHIGVYEIKRKDNDEITMFSFFDGKHWRGWRFQDELTIGNYPDQLNFIIGGQNRQWRGIVKDKK